MTNPTLRTFTLALTFAFLTAGIGKSFVQSLLPSASLHAIVADGGGGDPDPTGGIGGGNVAGVHLA